MSENKPTPELGDRDRKRCPVCGEPSYSTAGVHPQCSVKQADAERSQKLKESRLAGEANQAESKSTGPSRWQKVCPNCRAFLHVRKKHCECGHPFATKSQA
mgnify:FL=1